LQGGRKDVHNVIDGHQLGHDSIWPSSSQTRLTRLPSLAVKSTSPPSLFDSSIMPPRFYTSPYKNALAVPSKVSLIRSFPFFPLKLTDELCLEQREGWWSEIPVSTSAPSDSADLIKASSEYWIAQGNNSGQ